jgi:Domain of unknown function (DUF5076)
MMNGKPVPIDLVPYAGMLGNSREFLRVWAKEGGPVTCFINPVPVGGDPIGYGIALVDCIRHGAKTWARATGISETEAEARIWEGIDAERANLADIPAEHSVTDEDGLIH